VFFRPKRVKSGCTFWLTPLLLRSAPTCIFIDNVTHRSHHCITGNCCVLTKQSQPSGGVVCRRGGSARHGVVWLVVIGSVIVTGADPGSTQHLFEDHLD
jgi:hypothetical protein